MDLNFKNVARFVAENITQTARVKSLDFHALHRDAFSNIYLGLLLLDSFKLNQPISMAYSFVKEEGDPFEFPLIACEDALNFYLDRTYAISTRIDTDQIAYSLDDIFALPTIKTATDIGVIKESITEVLFNVQSHTTEPFSLIRFHLNEKRKYLDITIGDNGEGIKRTLMRKSEMEFLSDKADYEAIKEAMQRGVTSKIDKRGYGLAQIKDDFLNSSSDLLFISSGDGYYMINQTLLQTPIRAGKLAYSLPGVQVLMRFGCLND